MTGDQRHTISGEKTIFGEFSRVYALLTNTSLFDFFFLVSFLFIPSRMDGKPFQVRVLPKVT